MSGRFELWLFALQRLSAMVLAPLVLVHLGTMMYAVQDGLSASEILARTQANLLWPILYGIFVAAAALHGAIGLRTIIREMTPWRRTGANAVSALFCIAVLVLGIGAVGAIS